MFAIDDPVLRFQKSLDWMLDKIVRLNKKANNKSLRSTMVFKVDGNQIYMSMDTSPEYVRLELYNFDCNKHGIIMHDTTRMVFGMNWYNSSVLVPKQKDEIAMSWSKDYHRVVICSNATPNTFGVETYSPGLTSTESFGELNEENWFQMSTLHPAIEFESVCTFKDAIYEHMTDHKSCVIWYSPTEVYKYTTEFENFFEEYLKDAKGIESGFSC